MDTRTLLEKDQERFQTRLAQADTPEQTVTEIEEEMNRILLQYNESCTDERMSQAALHAMKTARASAALVNSGGEIRLDSAEGRGTVFTICLQEDIPDAPEMIE